MDKFFKLKEEGTNVKTEVFAGFTTFLTMAYIIFVNPNILSATGMDKGAVFVATILAAAFGTFVMGFFANVPFAQAPGMGLNAFFTFTIVLGLGFTWQQALAMVFICGIINILITVTSIRKMILRSIPENIQYAISGGIGLFIAYLGIKQAHFLKFSGDAADKISDGLYKSINPSLVNFTDPVSQVALIGLIITVILMIKKVKGSILIGIIATTIVGLFFGVTTMPEFTLASFKVPSLEPTFLQLDFKGLFTDPSRTFVSITAIFAFSLTDTFDTIGTFLGAGRKSGIYDQKDIDALEHSKGMHSKIERAFFADALATFVGSMLGTSNVTTFVESTSGISEGGRTGLTSVTTGICFLLCLFLSPIVGMVPSAATAPALIVVGILMAESLKNIEWDNLEIAVPAFMTVALMPFSGSITTGISAGFIFYCLAKLLNRKGKEIHPILYIVTVLFIINYVMMAFI